MKTREMLGLLLLVSFFVSGCATVSRVASENQEELISVEEMSPEQKAEWERADRDKMNPGHQATR